MRQYWSDVFNRELWGKRVPRYGPALKHPAAYSQNVVDISILHNRWLRLTTLRRAIMIWAHE